MERIEAFRRFYADLITANAGVEDGGLRAALQSISREGFVGPGPWKIFTQSGYITTPSDDPALLYQDIMVALDSERKINNGEPVLHAICIAALKPNEGDTAIHVGAGTGYYTAVLAKLVGPKGAVFAYEIDQDLAAKARTNLADATNVTVFSRSGAVGPLPDADVVYVNAGATGPLSVWLNALRPAGRLLFPLTPAEIDGQPAVGGMLLVTYASQNVFHARFICPAAFIPCVGGRDDETASKLSAAFARGDAENVRSLRRNRQPDESCWCAGDGWWLSTAVPVPLVGL
jgi:protein-L-isoaspartate(D-aspartate) O-methyltransferase